jgi:tetratricopeptide (TPR) repeat protein
VGVLFPAALSLRDLGAAARAGRNLARRAGTWYTHEDVETGESTVHEDADIKSLPEIRRRAPGDQVKDLGTLLGYVLGKLEPDLIFLPNGRPRQLAERVQLCARHFRDRFQLKDVAFAVGVRNDLLLPEGALRPPTPEDKERAAKCLRGAVEHLIARPEFPQEDREYLEGHAGPAPVPPPLPPPLPAGRPPTPAPPRPQPPAVHAVRDPSDEPPVTPARSRPLTLPVVAGFGLVLLGLLSWMSATGRRPASSPRRPAEEAPADELVAESGTPKELATVPGVPGSLPADEGEAGKVSSGNPKLLRPGPVAPGGKRPLVAGRKPASEQQRKAAAQHVGAARALCDGRDYDKAIAECDKALAADPDCLEAYFVRGEAKALSEKFAQAIDDLSAYLARAEQPDGDAYYYRGGAHFGIGLAGHPEAFREAIDDLTKALTHGCKKRELLHVRGCAHGQRGVVALSQKGATAAGEHWQAALKDFTEMIQRYPDFAPSYFERGHLLRLLGQYVPALGDLTEAIRLQPKSAAYYRERAAVYLALRQLPKAREDEETARKLN